MSFALTELLKGAGSQVAAARGRGRQCRQPGDQAGRGVLCDPGPPHAWRRLCRAGARATAPRRWSPIARRPPIRACRWSWSTMCAPPMRAPPRGSSRRSPRSSSASPAPTANPRSSRSSARSGPPAGFKAASVGTVGIETERRPDPGRTDDARCAVAAPRPRHAQGAGHRPCGDGGLEPGARPAPRRWRRASTPWPSPISAATISTITPTWTPIATPRSGCSPTSSPTAARRWSMSMIPSTSPSCSRRSIAA